MNLIVEASKAECKGKLRLGTTLYPCALGPSGLLADKQEGDGGTPLATMALTCVLYRPDRLPPPQTGLPIAPISKTDGWCDAPTSPAYNQPVNLPFAASHEKMWRTDHLYDICVILAWNLPPSNPNKGSAIFFHLAHPDYRSTEGCIAISQLHMLEILAQITPPTTLQTRWRR